jgi:GT2 family glycosyltransferase
MNKIGIGILTRNRPEFLNYLLETLKPCSSSIDEHIIINDGNRIDLAEGCTYTNIIHNDTNLGVCKSKNKALKYLLEKDCDHIFLIEDDMLIKREDIFQAYIHLAQKSGLHHLMFGYHGPANKGGISGGKPQPRLIIDYGDCKLALNPNCVGSFCYYTKESLNKVGLFDENFYQAFDHVEHTYRLSKAGFCTPYWWWPDLANSMDYIDEQECSEKSSAIRFAPKWQENIQKAAEYFKQKHGYLPAWQGCIPQTSQDDVIKFLKSKK